MTTSESGKPLYICHRTPIPIQVDGKLDDPAWKAASPIDLCRTQDGTKPRFATTARMLWDEDYLYIGYACEDQEIWATMSERDAHLWEEEVVEIFINPNGDEIGYIEIEVNPLNTLLDLYVLNRKGTPAQYLFDWNSQGIQHAVFVDGDPRSRDSQDRFWSVEVAIPWEDFATAAHLPPQIGDEWRVNLYRIDNYRGEEELSAWSPTYQPTFHVPQHFGVLRFSR
jgi:hypothetical protein